MHIVLDVIFMYIICGLALVLFLQINNLFVYTNTNLDEESQEQPGYWATRSLMFCIDIGIFITSVIVWPLVAAACISLNIFPDDSA